mmetsp:Transcript_6165/g.16431  ORF Transcript_6165/g.16431 Transcript_6165/m.16431 type:complete len:246 (-) Transcript_6165:247-984(-)
MPVRPGEERLLENHQPQGELQQERARKGGVNNHECPHATLLGLQGKAIGLQCQQDGIEYYQHAHHVVEYRVLDCLGQDVEARVPARSVEGRVLGAPEDTCLEAVHSTRPRDVCLRKAQPVRPQRFPHGLRVERAQPVRFQLRRFIGALELHAIRDIQTDRRPLHAVRHQLVTWWVRASTRNSYGRRAVPVRQEERTRPRRDQVHVMVPQSFDGRGRRPTKITTIFDSHGLWRGFRRLEGQHILTH